MLLAVRGRHEDTNVTAQKPLLRPPKESAEGRADVEDNAGRVNDGEAILTVVPLRDIYGQRSEQTGSRRSGQAHALGGNAFQPLVCATVAECCPRKMGIKAALYASWRSGSLGACQ